MTIMSQNYGNLQKPAWSSFADILQARWFDIGLCHVALVARALLL